MKKLLLAILLVSGSAVGAEAQMDFGLIGGVNFGYYNSVPPITDAISSLGYMIGVRGSLGTNLFLEPAVEFASYGSTIADGITNTTNHQMRSNYIRVPVELGARLFDDSPVNIEVRAGLSESFLVGYNDQVSSGPSAPFAKSDISGTRTAAIIGGGVRLFFLKLDVEYEWGLTNYFANNGASKLNAFYIILGGNF